MTLDDLKNMTKEDLLGKLGLAPKETFAEAFFPALGIFAAGVALGAGVALLLAPKSGAELRNGLTEGINALKGRVTRDNESSEPALTPSFSRPPQA